MFPCVVSLFVNLFPQPIEFSTGPHADYTHWKQTVFYLEEPITIGEGEKITGSIKCNPNAKNPRDLDILLDYKCIGAQCEADRSQMFRLR